MEPREAIKLRQYSSDICELFEDLLDRHNITIPDEDRTGDGDEARLYGMTYANLESDVTDVLRNLANHIQAFLALNIDDINL